MHTFVNFAAFISMLFLIVQMNNGLPIESDDKQNLPPLLFPTDADKFKIIPIGNFTALKILQASTRLQEVDNPKNDVEEIPAISQVESTDQLEEQYGAKSFSMQSSVPGFEDNTEVDHPKLQNSHILAIIGGALAAMCICALIGSVFWKKVVQRRYGMRTRLMTEDDFSGTH